jgi:hypothetical protein
LILGRLAMSITTVTAFTPRGTSFIPASTSSIVLD